MFKSRVSSTWVDEVRHSKLTNISQALNRKGVKHLPFVGVEFDEPVNWISDLMQLFWRQRLTRELLKVLNVR